MFTYTWKAGSSDGRTSNKRIIHVDSKVIWTFNCSTGVSPSPSITLSYLQAGEETGEQEGILSAAGGPQGAAAPPRRRPCHPGSGWAPVTPTSRWPVYSDRSWLVRPPCTGSWDRPGRWCTWTPRSFPHRFQRGGRSWNKPEFCRRTQGCSACLPWSSSKPLVFVLVALGSCFLAKTHGHREFWRSNNKGEA